MRFKAKSNAKKESHIEQSSLIYVIAFLGQFADSLFTGQKKNWKTCARETL